MTIRSVRIEYTVRSSADLDAVKARISEFVAGIKAHDSRHFYTSFQIGQTRQFVHVGMLEESRVADLQAQPWFGGFTAFLREHTEQPPTVTGLAPVASTR